MKNIRALILAVNSVIWLVVVSTLASEVSTVFKSFLTVLTGHHWVSKSLLSLLLFAVIYLTASRSAEQKTVRPELVYSVVVNAVLGIVIIFIFFLWHYLV